MMKIVKKKIQLIKILALLELMSKIQTPLILNQTVMKKILKRILNKLHYKLKKIKIIYNKNK